MLCGWVASSNHTAGGRKPAEALLNGSIAIFEQLGEKAKAAEGRIELACCYYHQGVFDLARSTLQSALRDLTHEDRELRCVALIRLAVVERFSGRLHDALALLEEAGALLDHANDWPRGRFHLEFANTLKDLGSSENRRNYLERALGHYETARTHFTKVRNHRYTAIVENNQGSLLSTLGRFDAALAIRQPGQ